MNIYPMPYLKQRAGSGQMNRNKVIQINLQEKFGGGEIYTAFLCRALSELGVQTTLICNRRSAFWHTLNLPVDTILCPVDSADDIAQALPGTPYWLLSHGPVGELLLPMIRVQGHFLTGICHMPPQGRRIATFPEYDMVFGVSGYVVNGLKAAGVKAWDMPLYGVADVHRGAAQPDRSVFLRQASPYDWDLRKFRERVFSWFEPLCEPFLVRPCFEKRPGITVGIVSRLATIKQFPQLFEQLAPILTRFPEVNIEVFGSGGYTMVRDLRLAIAPIRDRVRFWGHQGDVAAVYAQIDYLLSGLPEKEALGLNILEAQAAGVPVIAVNAPPFNETVRDGVSGYLYTDPRQDRGQAFGALLGQLTQPAHQRLLVCKEHLQQFTAEAFRDRLKPILAMIPHG